MFLDEFRASPNIPIGIRQGIIQIQGGDPISRAIIRVTTADAEPEHEGPCVSVAAPFGV